jgi:predicted Zn-dependent protease
MATPQDDARAGLDALRRGETITARDLLLRALEGGEVGTAVLFGVAAACRQLADARGAAAALDRLLRTEPRNLAALIQRGDLHADAGDSRAAVSPNTSEKACRSAMSTSAIVTGSPRSTSEVTP